MLEQIDEIQEQILIACSSAKSRRPVVPYRGRHVLMLDIDEKYAEYLDVNDRWISEMVGIYLEKEGDEFYKLTKMGEEKVKQIQAAVK